MSHRAFHTLADLARARFRLLFCCPTCGHRQLYNPAGLALVHGLERAWADLTLTCDGCGGAEGQAVLRLPTVEEHRAPIAPGFPSRPKPL